RILIHPSKRDSVRIPIVIVIVIESHFVPLFFFKSGTLILAFFCITIIGAQEYHTTIYHTTQHTMPSLWVRSGSTPKIGGKENPKRDEKDLDVV
ncbi:MAG: hypothetical protein IKH33_04120, partial [Bacteroidales bacterium]|nr:hypothetical protein [Bacteroidales bacterium]